MNRRQFIRNNLWVLTGSTAVLDFLDPSKNALEPDYWKIDTHMHLFDLNQFKYPWLQNVGKINRSFSLDDYVEATREASVGQMIFMESGTAPQYSLAEAQWVSKLSSQDDRIRGIVAQVDMETDLGKNPDLRGLKEIELLKGGRGKFQPESPFFLDNLKRIGDLGWTFDLLLSGHQLEEAVSFIRQAPNTRFILDHLGNPDYRLENLEKWRSGIDALAALPNINCKVSGIISRIGMGWQLKDILPYYEHVMNSFGSDRLIFGGDWPVVLLAGTYQNWSETFDRLTVSLTPEDRTKIFRNNALRIYNL